MSLQDSRHRELQGLCSGPWIKLMTENSELGSSVLPILLHLPIQPFVPSLDGDSFVQQEHLRLRGNRSLGGSCFLCPVPQKEVFSSQHRGSWWREVQEKHCCVQVMTKHLQIQPGSAELGSCKEPRAASHHTNTHQKGGALGPETPQTNTAAVGEAVGRIPQGRKSPGSSKV